MSVRTSRSLLFLVLSLQCFECKNHGTDLSSSNKVPWTLEDVFSQAGQNTNLKCLIVFQNDRILKERYFHPGDSLNAHDVRSVTKSVMATLIGIAIDRGIIPSEDRTIGEYLQPTAPLSDSVKAHITIKQLLSMSSGLSGNDLPDVTEYNNWFNAPNQVQYTLSLPMIAQPGQVFGYNTGAAHLTSVLLTGASGGSTYQFAKQYLFQPLGIPDRPWATDKQGFNNGGAALSLTPYDMLKIGQLYLNKGVFNGIRVVSDTWIDKASSFKISTNNAQLFGPNYGYFWWLGNTGHHDYSFANGYGGQFIVVVPDLRLIVIATNMWSNVPTSTASQQWYTTIDLIMNKIIPLYE